ncbi:hypothetical protein Tco_0064548 [Tanacetum coccineum]
MFKDDSYTANTIHNDLYEDLQKSLKLDYSNQRLADQEEARKKRQKRRNVPRTPPGSPPSQPPPLLPLAGASGALSTSRASGYSQFPPPPPYLSTSTSGSAQQQSNKAPSSSKTAVSASQSMAWTTSDTRYESAVNKTTLTQADFKGHAYEVVKAFYPDVVHLQFQMEECHKMISDHIDWTNPEGVQVRVDVSQPLPLGGPLGSNPALSISKMKATSYPDFGLELLVPEQIHDSPSRRKDVRTHMRILSVVRIKAYSRYGYDYLSEVVLRRADFQEYTVDKKDFKNLYSSDFEDQNLLLLQGHLDHLPGSDKRMLSTAVKQWTRNLVIRQRVKDFQLALDYRVKEFKVKRLNPGMNTRFWTQKDVARSKEFIAAIERRLKTRRIFQNLECFVGGRVRDIDYKLLQRTE